MSSLSNSGMNLGREEAELVLSQRRRRQAAAGDLQEEFELREGTSLPPFLERMFDGLPEITCDEMSEEEFRASYFRANRNPRLIPSPEESYDDRRIEQSSRSFGGTADQRRSSRAIEEGNNSLFSWQPDFGIWRERQRERELAIRNAFNSQGDGLIGLRVSFINDFEVHFHFTSYKLLVLILVSFLMFIIHCCSKSFDLFLTLFYVFSGMLRFFW